MLACPSCRAPLPERAERCPWCGADARVAVVVDAPDPAASSSGGTSRPSRRRWIWLAAPVAAAWIGLWLASSLGHDARVAPAPSPTALAAPGDARAPIRTETLSFCHGNEVAAYDGDGLYYPQNHPAPPPPSERISWCFGWTGSAESAGYRLAPAPAGTIEAGGFYLVPTGRLVEDCRRAAGGLSFSVPCPAMLPTLLPGSPGATCREDFLPMDRACVAGDWFVLNEQDLAPPAARTASPSVFAPPNVTVLAHPLGSAPPFPVLACPGVQSAGSPGAATAPFGAIFLTCPDPSGVQSGHVILQWNAGGITYAVSIFGNSLGSREVLEQLAASMAYVTDRAAVRSFLGHR
jgi:hypothetical protein